MDVDKYVQDLWREANIAGTAPGYKLTETSVTGNMPAQEMNDRRLKWTTVEGSAHTVAEPRELDTSSVTLMPQQIRVFIVEYLSSQTKHDIEIIQ
jgi:hypothetical protein